MQPEQARNFRVGGADAGVRLDVFLAERLAVSRGTVRRLLGGAAVRLNNRVVTLADKGLLLEAGRVVSVEAFRSAHQMCPTPRPDIELPVLQQGEGFVVVDKPAGLPVHPLDEGESDTVLNAVAARWPGVQGVGEGGLRSGVVHRLDVDTSGVLVIATQQDAWRKLRDAFTLHRAEKVYRAVVAGVLRGEGETLLDLYTAQHRPAKVRVFEGSAAHRPRGLRRCDTRWRVVEPLAGATLVEVRIGTGFLHQVRVTMAHLGHPILGDRLYGRPDAVEAPRLMLHASRLTVEGVGVNATSPDPAEFEQTLTALRSPR